MKQLIRNLCSAAAGLGLAIFFVFTISAPVFADTETGVVTINVTVTSTDGGGAPVCGNGIVESGEACDDGGSNGACPAACSSSCTVNSCGGGGGPGPSNDPPVISNVNPNVTSGGTASLSWTATDDDGTVESCSMTYGPTQSYGSTASSISRAGSSFFTVVPAAYSPVYFRIECVDNDGAIDIDTATAAAVPNQPPVITNLVAVPAETTVAMTWDAMDPDGYMSGCVVQFPTPPVQNTGGFYSGIPVGDGFAQSVSYTRGVALLQPGTTYEYNVICADTENALVTVSASFTTLSDTTPPPAVLNLSASGLVEAATVGWDYSASISDLQRFDVFVSQAGCPAPTNNSDPTFLTSQLPLQSNTYSYLHNGLTAGVEYFYTVVARDSSGNYSTQACDSAVPLPGDTGEEAVCGNGIIETGEQCDGTALGGATCSANGFDGGVMTCTASCQLDTTQCTNAPATCGNGVLNVGEQCDDGNSVNTDGCTNVCTTPRCGDGVIQLGEQCDGGNLGGASCLSLNFDGGTLVCSPGCQLDASQCTEDDGPGPQDGAELICNDGIDNDNDGPIDCADTDCRLDPVCQDAPPPPPSGSPACSDGIDNDGDGVVDMNDPGCDSPQDDDEYNEPTETVDPTDQLPDSALSFYIAERTIRPAVQDQEFSTLVSDQITVVLNPDGGVSSVSSTVLYFGGSRYVFGQEADGLWYADVMAPTVGVMPGVVEVRYQNGLIETLSFRVDVQPYGRVRAPQTVDGAEVRLYDLQTGAELLWNGDRYRQQNPLIVDEGGAYGYVVENGRFRLVATRDGFRTRTTNGFTVTDNVVNRDLSLIPLPATPLDTIPYVGEVLIQEAADVVAVVNEIADNPIVEQVTEQIVVPSVATAAAIVVLPSLWSILLPLLRFLFFQPLLLLGRRKRAAWGQVYNSLTKLPVDLATVRLINVETGKIIQSRVTDTDGRYLFLVEKGQYKIEVFKKGFLFPTTILAAVRSDGRMVDIYHGEVIKVTQDGTDITPNIPIDPEDAPQKTPRRIWWERIGRGSQYAVSLLGVLLTAIAYYIQPSPITLGFLIAHIILFALFLRYVRPRKPTGWGIVYEERSKKPVGRVVARLFTKEFDKLVASQLTDSKGRYSFLVGPNEYYVTFEKDGYEQERTGVLDYTKKQEDVIKENVPIEKAGSGGAADTNTT